MGTSLTQLASLAAGNPVQGLVFNPPPVPTPAQSLVFTPPAPPATPVTAVPPAVAPPQSPQIALAPPVPLPPQLTPQSRAPAPQDDATAPTPYYPPAPPTQPFTPSGTPVQPGGGTMAVPSTPNQQNPDLSGGQDGQPTPGVTPAAFRPGVPTPRPYGAIPTPNGGVPKWQTMPPAALYSPVGLPPLFYAMARPESGLNNRSVGDNGLATGYLQIQTPTWREFAPKAGVDVSRWPTAASAPLQVQWAVAQTIPLDRWTAGKDGALAMYPWARPDMTVGQIQAAAALAGPQGYNPTSSANGGDRDPEHWGTTPYGGYGQGPGNMPQNHSDVGGIMKAGLYLLPFLSIFAKGGAMPMLASWGSFMTGFQKGQILAQQQAHQQWKDGVEETTERMKRESMEAGDAFATYQNDEKALDEALYAVAAKYGDDPMRAALASGGAAAVHRLQQNRDNYFTDLNKTRLANEAEQQKIDEGKRKAQQEAQQDAAVAGLDQQYLQDHPNASQAELANAHQINVGKVAAERKPPTASETGEGAAVLNVMGPDGKPTGQQVREGKSGGLRDVSTDQPVTLQPGQTVQKPAPGAGAPAKPKMGAFTWEDTKGQPHGPQEVSVESDGVYTVPGHQKITDINPGTFRPASVTTPPAPQTYTGPDTWEGAPNKPPPGTNISPSVWEAALQLAETGVMPQGYGQRNIQQTQQVLDAAVVARKVLGINAVDEWRQQAKIKSATIAEEARDRYFASGYGERQMNSMNTIASHINLFREYAEALHNNEVIRANQLANRLSVEFGGAQVPDFNTARTLMADEVIRLLTTTGGSRMDRKDAQEQVDSAMSGKQLEGVADVLQNFIRGKFGALQQDYVTLPGRTMTPGEIQERTGQFQQMLVPEARSMFESPDRPVPGLDQTAPAQKTQTQAATGLPDWAQQRGTDKAGNTVLRGTDGKLYNPDHTPYQAPQ